MAELTEEMLSAEVHEKITSGLDKMTGAEAQEAFSERLENFLEEKGLSESAIISGQSEYAPVISEAAFNGLDFSGMEATGLSLADVRHMMTDKDHQLEMAEEYLTGDAEDGIEDENSQAFAEAVRTKEFMHYELRDALNAGPEGAPATIEGFLQDEDIQDWQQMLGDQAAFHQNGGAEDKKFVNLVDGREVVYDGDTKELMTADNGNAEFMGTYNYVNATIPNDTTPGIIDTIENATSEGSSRHTDLDVKPWVEMGNTRAEGEIFGGALKRDLDFKAAVAKGGANALGNDVDDIQNLVGDKLGGLRDAVSIKAGEIRDSVTETAGDVRDVVSEKIDQAGEVLSDAGEAIAETAGDVRDAVSETMDQAGEAINDTYEDAKGIGRGWMKDAREAFDNLTGRSDDKESTDFMAPENAAPSHGSGGGSWQEGALNSGEQTMNGAQVQEASLSDTTTPTGTIQLEDAIGMLTADQKALNAAVTGEETSSVQEAVNHPDAAQMFKNLHTYGVETVPAEITPEMGAEDRVRELLLAGQEATKEVGIPMPAEQRELDAAQELNKSYQQQLNNSYEEEYSAGL